MTYTIRNVDEKTKRVLSRYAGEHGITVGEAMQQLIESGLEYYQQNRKITKKYSGARDALESMPKW